MVLKSKRSSIPTSTSTTFNLLSKSSLSLQCFPPEILLMTFQNLDIPTLLDLCNVCKLFLQIGTDVLSRKFQDPKVGLMLTFEQEHKYKSDVPFEFWKSNEKNGNFIFRPIPSKSQPIRFVHSSVVRKPVLSKVSTVGINDSSDPPPSPHHYHHDAERNNPKSKKLEENLLQNSLSLTIKSHGGTVKKIRHAYRVGHGTTHLRIPYIFTYTISNTPPPSIQSTRNGGGERWVTPLYFECAPSFFYPREPIARQIIMTIIQLRKRNLIKKKPSNPPSTNHLSKQKQDIDVNITIEEVDDFNLISTNSNTKDQVKLNPTTNRRLSKRQLNQQEHYLYLSFMKKSKGSSRRCVRGPRG